MSYIACNAFCHALKYENLSSEKVDNHIHSNIYNELLSPDHITKNLLLFDIKMSTKVAAAIRETNSLAAVS